MPSWLQEVDNSYDSPSVFQAQRKRLFVDHTFQQNLVPLKQEAQDLFRL